MKGRGLRPREVSSDQDDTGGLTNQPSTEEEAPMERRYVGIDLHRRRSVIMTMDEAGEVLSSVRIPNDPVAMSLAVAEAGEGAEVAFEAT